MWLNTADPSATPTLSCPYTRILSNLELLFIKINMNLNSETWSTLAGGYHTPYNASVPLKQLQSSNDRGTIEKILTELWDNLHHQGDVGLASYLALPHLVTICMNKRSIDPNFIGLCTIIELCRHSKQNPELPDEYKEEYQRALNEFATYLHSNYNSIQDQVTLRLALSFLATAKGQWELGRAIMSLEEDTIKELDN